MSRIFSNASRRSPKLCARLVSKLQLPGLHLGAVLGALQVPHLRRDPVDGAVEAADLAVQHIDDMFTKLEICYWE